MSFSPLPATLSADLRAVSGPVLDLGCGDGLLTRHLRREGGDVLGLDRSRELGRRPDIVGDVAQPPVKPETVAVIVAGNLWRHLEDPWSCLQSWGSLLAPEGILWILEDEPSADGRPGALYRDLQAFLSRVAPGSRGPLMPQADFVRRLPDREGWTFGLEDNAQSTGDLSSLSTWLTEAAGTGSREAGSLLQRIREEGLVYGRYWWARRSGKVRT